MGTVTSDGEERDAFSLSSAIVSNDYAYRHCDSVAKRTTLALSRPKIAGRKDLRIFGDRPSATNTTYVLVGRVPGLTRFGTKYSSRPEVQPQRGGVPEGERGRRHRGRVELRYPVFDTRQEAEDAASGGCGKPGTLTWDDREAVLFFYIRI